MDGIEQPLWRDVLELNRVASKDVFSILAEEGIDVSAAVVDISLSDWCPGRPYDGVDLNGAGGISSI